jgi:hypothetical protein
MVILIHGLLSSNFPDPPAERLLISDLKANFNPNSLKPALFFYLENTESLLTKAGLYDIKDTFSMTFCFTKRIGFVR